MPSLNCNMIGAGGFPKMWRQSVLLEAVFNYVIVFTT
ncbi:hypothetical protein A2U01_0112762, partial [Trifolium medium]|nr:hypothetical protein [Trifolium medium]